MRVSRAMVVAVVLVGALAGVSVGAPAVTAAGTNGHLAKVYLGDQDPIDNLPSSGTTGSSRHR